MLILGHLHRNLIEMIIDHLNETELAAFRRSCRRFHNIEKVHRQRRPVRTFLEQIAEDNVYALQRYAIPHFWQHEHHIIKARALKTFRWYVRTCVETEWDMIGIGVNLYRLGDVNMLPRFLEEIKDHSYFGQLHMVEKMIEPGYGREDRIAVFRRYLIHIPDTTKQ